MLKLKNIKKTFEDKILFENFSKNFEYGEIISIFGKSGSGKSTLLKIIANLSNWEKGEIKFENKILKKNDLNFYTENCFYLNSSPILSDSLSFKDYFNLFKKTLNTNLNENFIKKIIEIFEIKDFYEKLSSEISTGQKYRLSWALSLLSDKKILLWDEPTANLNQEISKKILDFCFEIKKNKIILIATHDKFILNYSDKIINL